MLTIGIDTGKAELLGSGEVPLRSAIDAATGPGVDLYGAILGMPHGVLNIGRDRRFPTLLQRLAVIVRDRRCRYPGCDRPHTRCEAHHLIEYDDGGPTVVDNLALLCAAHHHHLHGNRLVLHIHADGSATVHARDGTVVADRAPPDRQAAYRS